MSKCLKKGTIENFNIEAIGIKCPCENQVCEWKMNPDLVYIQ